MEQSTVHLVPVLLPVFPPPGAPVNGAHCIAYGWSGGVLVGFAVAGGIGRHSPPINSR